MKKVLILSIVIFLLYISPWAAMTANAEEYHSDAERVASANAGLKHALDLVAPSKETVITMLIRKDFSALESLLSNLENNFKKDLNYESSYLQTYEYFKPDDGDLLPFLDAWVATTNSYMSYGARGAYEVYVGDNARGTRYISETKQENIDLMHRWHAKAMADLKSAINIKPDFLSAYLFLIAIGTYSGDSEMTTRYYTAAIRAWPQSYYARTTYLVTLQPRWGGSYAQLLNFTREEATKNSSFNPRLWSLQGEVYAEQGYTYFLYDDYDAAINSYKKALQYGDRTKWLKLLALCYIKSNRYDLAKPFLEKSLYYNADDIKARQVLEKVSLHNSMQSNEVLSKQIDYYDLF